MKQTPIAIEKATDDQLKDFAELFLQIDTKDCRTRADLMAKIGPAWAPPHIFVEAAAFGDEDDQDEDTKAAPRLEIPFFNKFKDPRWLVKLGATSLPGGEDPVAVGVNGDIVVIQREMEVHVPHRFIETLRNAVRVSMTQNMQTQEMTVTRFTNYPIEVIERPSRAAIEAFLEETNDQILVG